MPVRLPISKLAASAVAPLQTSPRFTNDLLQSGANWPQDVNYLRDTYMEIYDLWERLKEPVQDVELFQETAPKLRELLLGLGDVSKELSMRRDIARDVTNAQHDFDIAESYSKAGDFGMGTVYQSYAMMKTHRILDTLTLDANKKRGSRRKLGYGYDVSGEVFERGGTDGKSPELDDLGNSPKFDKTPPNPVAVAQDYEAEEDFPELAEIKHKRVEWPQRTR
jgi:hypothetical protein